MSQSASTPFHSMIARIRVVAAMVASAVMSSSLRLWRSAHTPPNTDITAWGRKPKAVASVRTTPDCVSRVRYHRIEYWTRDEPSSDTVWPDRKNVVSRIHRSRAMASANHRR